MYVYFQCGSYLVASMGLNIFTLCLIVQEQCSFDYFFNSDPLSGRQTMDEPVLERFPERYVSTTDSAALLGIGTAMMYDVNKSIQVSACLLPEEVVGNLPMAFIAMHAKGTFGISKSS